MINAIFRILLGAMGPAGCFTAICIFFAFSFILSIIKTAWEASPFLGIIVTIFVIALFILPGYYQHTNSLSHKASKIDIPGKTLKEIEDVLGKHSYVDNYGYGKSQKKYYHWFKSSNGYQEKLTILFDFNNKAVCIFDKDYYKV